MVASTATTMSIRCMGGILLWGSDTGNRTTRPTMDRSRRTFVASAVQQSRMHLLFSSRYRN